MNVLEQILTFPLDNKDIALNLSSLKTAVLDNSEDGESSATQGVAVTQAPAAQGTEDTETAQPGGLMSLLPIIVIYGGLGVAIYFFLFRPQRKRDKQTAEMQNSLKVGDNVLTSGGLYGKIVEVGQDAHVVEFGSNRGVRVAVRKTDILGIKTPVLTPPHNKDLPAADSGDKNKK